MSKSKKITKQGAARPPKSVTGKVSSPSPATTTTRAQDLARLQEPENQQRLRDLLDGYDVLMSQVQQFLEEQTDSPKKLNIAYVRFLPCVEELIQQLHLNPNSDSTIKLDSRCIPSASLYEIEGEFEDGEHILTRAEITRKVMVGMHSAYGNIKRLFEGAGAADTRAPDNYREHLALARDSLLGIAPAGTPENITLAGKTVSYDADSSSIVIDGEACPLSRPAGHGSHRQRVVAEAVLGPGGTVGSGIPWEDLYRVAVPRTPISDNSSTKADQRKYIQSARRSINANIINFFHTTDKLLGWSGDGRVVRNF